MNEFIVEKKISQLYQEYNFLGDFFASAAIQQPHKEEEETLLEWFNKLDPYELEEKGIDKNALPEQFQLFMDNMNKIKDNQQEKVKSVTIIGG